jgi:hypothetical protein
MQIGSKLYSSNITLSAFFIPSVLAFFPLTFEPISHQESPAQKLDFFVNHIW